MKKLIAHLSLAAASAGAAGVLILALADAVIMPYIVDVPSVKIPRLENLSSAQAAERLQQWGLKMALGDSMHHERIALGSVIDHVPEAGQRVKRGRAVTVLLSRGPRYYSTPDLHRVSQREARLQLESKQLGVGSILYVSSSEVSAGAVIDQTPAAGTALVRGSRVDLRISNGPPSSLKSTPNLLRLSIEVVEDSLRKYEMQLGRVENKIDNSAAPGTILSQVPAPGTPTPRNTRINLRVSAKRRDDGGR